MGNKGVETACRPAFSHSQIVGSTHSCRHLVGKCAGKGRTGAPTAWAGDQAAEGGNATANSGGAVSDGPFLMGTFDGS